jgi:glycyl-tRNA synthetase alpha chain
VNFQDFIRTLDQYWADQGCVLTAPLDLEVGAGTFHPATFLRSIGPEPWNAAYIQPCGARPTSRPLRREPQPPAALLPVPGRDEALAAEFSGALPGLAGCGRHRSEGARYPLCRGQLGIADPGAWGLGWEVWLNGMEVTQFTYFQQAGGLECKPVMGEITYGLERLAMYLQGVESSSTWSGPRDRTARHLPRGVPPERSRTVDLQLRAGRYPKPVWLVRYLRSRPNLVDADLPLPAYDQVLKASHTFNLLDARQAISVTERQRYILRVRDLSRRWPKPITPGANRSAFPGVKQEAAA